VHPSASDEDRAARAGNELGGLPHGVLRRHRAVQRVLAEPDPARRLAGGSPREDIARQQQGYGPGPAGAGSGHGRIDVLIHPCGVIERADPLGARGEQCAVVELLEGVAVPVACRHVLDEGEERHRGLQRLRHRGNEQSGGRPVLSGYHSDPARDPGKTVGHGPAGILCPVGDLADPGHGRGEEQRRGQALPEDAADTVACQRPGQRIGYGAFGHQTSLRGLWLARYRASVALRGAVQYSSVNA
jgi:hypothetical protein